MRQHASIRFQTPLILARMRRILGSLALLWLCATQPAQAQYQEKYFWWGATPTALRDSMTAQQYWRETAQGTEDPGPNQAFEIFYSLDLQTVVVFSFYYDMLVKSVWRLDKASTFSQGFEEYISESKRVSENMWYHPASKTIFTRTYESTGTITYTRAPDLGDALEKKLSLSK